MTSEQERRTYAARLCWNTNRWIRPTGDSGEAQGTYTSTYGVGHEEWLFNYAYVLDGWKYGFLQPVNKSKDHLRGKVIDLRLYTIGPGSNWRYVGHIDACEVLRPEESRAARREFKRRGWLGEMIRDVKEVDGDPSCISEHAPESLFNVRFRPRHAQLYDVSNPAMAMHPTDPVRKLRRYSLVELTGKRKKIEERWPFRAGSDDLRGTSDLVRGAVAEVRVKRRHNELQNALFTYLQQRFGTGAVLLEKDFVDITLRTKKACALIEVKSDPRPGFAIREALGQLLQYAYRAALGPADLIIAGPGEVSDDDRRYLEHLRTERNVPVNYLQVRRGRTELELTFAVPEANGWA